MLRPFLLSATLCLVASMAVAQPTQDEIAEARLHYIDGDYAEALEVLVPAAEAGDANAQNILADAYDQGNGVPADPDLALDWWKKSAAQGFSRALHNLGLYYETTDPETARGYYERAVAQDNAGSMTNLGYLYESAALTGSPAWEEAVPLYERAVELGDVQGMINLANYHLEPDLDEDFARALTLFRMAAERGNTTALTNLGVMYDRGYGVSHDPFAALALYLMAARQGYAQAAINVAYTLIEDDIGALHDPATGWAWCQVGLEQADDADRSAFVEDCQYLSEMVDAAARVRAEEIRPTLLR